MATRSYLLGSTFSAADIMMGYTIGLIEALIPDRFPPGLRPYYERLLAREAFQKARAA